MEEGREKASDSKRGQGMDSKNFGEKRQKEGKPIFTVLSASHISLTPQLSSFHSWSFNSPQREGKKPVSLLTSAPFPQTSYHPFPTMVPPHFASALLICPTGSTPTLTQGLLKPLCCPDGNLHLRLKTKKFLRAACSVWAEEMLDWAYKLREKEYCQVGSGVPSIGERSKSWKREGLSNYSPSSSTPQTHSWMDFPRSSSWSIGQNHFSNCPLMAPTP